VIRIQDVNGLKIACWINTPEWQADRKTLFFIHGSGGDHSAWLHQCSALKDMFNIAALDLPGHGRSGGTGEQSVAAYVEWIRKILRAFAVEKPVLVGHSLGAAISLHYALNYGHDLAAIVPVGGGAAMPVNPLILDSLKTDPATVIAMAVKFSVAKSNRDRLSEILMKGMSSVDPMIIHGDFTSCDRHDVTAMLPRIQVPALVICGEEDKMTPPAMSQYLADHIPGARFRLIQNAGHFVFLENVEEFNREIREFVVSLP
jgi:pimeloyl-ACP methyl ester carboxylesterase